MKAVKIDTKSGMCDVLKQNHLNLRKPTINVSPNLILTDQSWGGGWNKTDKNTTAFVCFVWLTYTTNATHTLINL